MLKVDNRVVQLKLRKVTNNGIDIRLLRALAMPLTPLQVGKELKLCNENKAKGLRLKALVQGAYGKKTARLKGLLGRLILLA